MKKLLLILLVLPVWAGCTKTNLLKTKEFVHTGCAHDAGTRVESGSSDISLITLKYEDGNLRVTHTNALLNCAFEERGLVCNVSVDGDVILFLVEYDKQEDLEADCLCRVEKMTAVVTGLETGKEYTLKYRVLDRGYKPIAFTFNEGLHEIFDTDTL